MRLLLLAGLVLCWISITCHTIVLLVTLRYRLWAFTDADLDRMVLLANTFSSDDLSANDYGTTYLMNPVRESFTAILTEHHIDVDLPMHAKVNEGNHSLDMHHNQTSYAVSALLFFASFGQGDTITRQVNVHLHGMTESQQRTALSCQSSDGIPLLLVLENVLDVAGYRMKGWKLQRGYHSASVLYEIHVSVAPQSA